MENEYFASINEVSKQLGLPAHTLRYWEKQFPNVVRPVAGAGGRRREGGHPLQLARGVGVQDGGGEDRAGGGGREFEVHRGGGGRKRVGGDRVPAALERD